MARKPDVELRESLNFDDALLQSPFEPGLDFDTGPPDRGAVALVEGDKGRTMKTILSLRSAARNDVIGPSHPLLGETTIRPDGRIRTPGRAVVQQPDGHSRAQRKRAFANPPVRYRRRRTERWLSTTSWYIVPRLGN